MSRIAAAFGQSGKDYKKGFIPFITAGDPDLTTTSELLVELSNSGSTLIELGVPFSDPIADGPVIQRASERALRQNVNVQNVIDMVSQTRSRIDVPVVLFSYYNPLLQYGLEKTARESAEAGIDGILITDLPPEESSDFLSLLKRYKLDMIFLVAPTTPDARLESIARSATGFIYAVSRRGVTGVQENVGSDAEVLVKRVRSFSSLPVAVGFGISSAEQVAQTWRYADAAVVGSAIVGEMERLAGTSNFVLEVGKFVRSLIPGIE